MGGGGGEGRRGGGEEGEGSGMTMRDSSYMRSGLSTL